MTKRTVIYSFLMFAFVLLAGTYKIATLPIYSFDSYMYSYIASEDLRTFKAVPGLPDAYAAMSNDVYGDHAPYYTVKVLYVALVRIAAPIVGPLRAPSAISAGAYILLGLVVWCWLRSLSVREPWGSLAALLIMFSSVVVNAARMGTPDTLCSLLLVAGAWLLTATRHAYLGAGLLILAGYARADSFVLAGLLVALAAWQQRTSLRFAVMALATMIASYVAISTLGYSYEQLIGLMLSQSARPSYADALLHNLVKTEVAAFSPFVLLALIACKGRYQVELLAICAISLVARYALLPHIETRYLIPQAIIAAVVGTASVFRENAADIRKNTLLNEELRILGRLWR